MVLVAREAQVLTVLLGLILCLVLSLLLAVAAAAETQMPVVMVVLVVAVREHLEVLPLELAQHPQFKATMVRQELLDITLAVVAVLVLLVRQLLVVQA